MSNEKFLTLVLSDLRRKEGAPSAQLVERLDDWRSALTKMLTDADVALSALKSEEESGKLESLSRGRNGISIFLQDKEERDAERRSKLTFRGAVMRRLTDVNSRIKARNVTESSKGHESIAERLDRIEAKLDRLLAMALDAGGGA